MLCVVTENTDRVVGEQRMATFRDLAAAVAGTRTEPDVLAAVNEQLGRNLSDLPFSATYLFDSSGAAHLGCSAGITADSAAAPSVLPADDPDPVWPTARLLAGEQVLVEDLADRFPELPTGAWQQPPTQAVAVPIAASAQEHDR